MQTGQFRLALEYERRPTSNARELRQIVNDRLVDLNVIVDEGHSSLLAFASNDRYSS